MKTKKIAAAALGAALLGGTGLTTLMTTGAGAANSDASSSSSSTATKAAPGQWMSDALAKLVTAGTLTQSQADAVTKALDAARPEGGPGMGRGGGPGLTVAAEALGMEASALRTQLQAGKTIAEIATANGVDLQTVIDAIVASEKTHLAEAVTDGRLTRAEADERAANAVERATNMVNGIRPERPTAGADSSS